MIMVSEKIYQHGFLSNKFFQILREKSAYTATVNFQYQLLWYCDLLHWQQ